MSINQIYQIIYYSLITDAAKKNSAEKPPKNIKRNLFAEGNNSGGKHMNYY